MRHAAATRAFAEVTGEVPRSSAAVHPAKANFSAADEMKIGIQDEGRLEGDQNERFSHGTRGWQHKAIQRLFKCVIYDLA